MTQHLVTLVHPTRGHQIQVTPGRAEILRARGWTAPKPPRPARKPTSSK